MSPFLFILVEESLNLMLRKICEVGWLQGFDVTPGGTEVSHLQSGRRYAGVCAGSIGSGKTLEKGLKVFLILK